MVEEAEEPQPYVFTLSDGSTTLEGSENFTGQATAAYENGDQYVGAWQDGLRQGSGVYTWKSGAIFTGEYSGNVRHGQGKLSLPDGSWFEGFFENGQRTFGTIRYANGDAYHGAFAGPQRHGQGVYIFHTCKSRLRGHWAQGALLRGSWQLHSGQTWTPDEGDDKDGSRGRSFELNKPSGQGVWRLANNTVRGSYAVHKAPVDFAPDSAVHPPTAVTAHWSTNR